MENIDKLGIVSDRIWVSENFTQKRCNSGADSLTDFKTRGVMLLLVPKSHLSA